MDTAIAESEGIEDDEGLELERLVQRLYQPGSTQEIRQINDSLQAIQRSSQGWQLADKLLHSQDSKVRFFGALTFTIKINKDWSDLDSESATSILQRLLHWFVKLVNANDSSLVIRKVCAALIACYLRPTVSWEPCIKHLMVCVLCRYIMPAHGTREMSISTRSLIAELSVQQLIPVMWFAGGLVDEVGNVSSANSETHKYHERVLSNVDDAVILLQWAIKSVSLVDSNGMNPLLPNEGLKCFRSWTVYANRAWNDKTLELHLLQPLTSKAIKCLEHEETYEEATDLLTELLNSLPRFFTPDDLDMLSTVLVGEEGQSLLSELKGGNLDHDVVAFARLLLAYGDANLRDLSKSENNVSKQILRQLLELLSCEGYAGVDDLICTQALEFWAAFIEFLTEPLNDLIGDQEPYWLESARDCVREVIERCWNKIQLPPSEIALTWDADEQIHFKSFRMDVQDMLLSSYSLFGTSLFGKLSELAVQSLTAQKWSELEAAIFCINALSDAVAEEDTADQFLSKLFQSSLFGDLTNSQDNDSVKTRQTAMNMVTTYTAFFERNAIFLPPMLNFLFESLKAPLMSLTAAKAIFEACSSCRKVLVPELNIFLRQYQMIASWEVIDSYINERVIGAITAIVQALATDEEKLSPLSTLIQFVNYDVEKCLGLMNDSRGEESQATGIGALRCLVGMARSLQTPDDVAIDLDAEHPQLDFWSQGAGAMLQSNVVSLLEKLTRLLSWDNAIIESACHILRAGYKESIPGLFVFPPQVTVSLVVNSSLDTAMLDYVLDTGGAMIGRRSLSSRPGMQSAAQTLMSYNLQLVASLSSISDHPEVASSAIDLFEKMIPHYVTSIMTLEGVLEMFNFCLASLEVAEVMPKSAAAHFWATCVQRYELPENEALWLDAVLKQSGPRLCHMLVRKIGGEAARSELLTVTEPLRKLVFAQPQAKQWLAQALEHPSFPSKKVGSTEKRIWLQKIISLRGARGTIQVVKDFWIACSGAEFAYAS